MIWNPLLIVAAVLGGLTLVFAGFAVLFRMLGKRDLISPILHRYRIPIVIAIFGLGFVDIAIELVEGLRTGNFGPVISLVVFGLLFWHFRERLFHGRSAASGIRIEGEETRG